MAGYHDDIWGDDQRGLRNRLEVAFNKGRKHVRMLLPDTCTVTPATGLNPVMSAKGVLTSDDSIARTYLGYSTIPCRGDEVRSFRPDELGSQPTQVDEIDLHLPSDFVLEESDVIVYRGFTYKIRKMAGDSDFGLTQVAKIMRLGDSLD